MKTTGTLYSKLTRSLTLLAKKLSEEATTEDLLELKKLQGLYPEICYHAELIIQWWCLDKIEEQKNRGDTLHWNLAIVKPKH